MITEKLPTISLNSMLFFIKGHKQDTHLEEHPDHPDRALHTCCAPCILNVLPDYVLCSLHTCCAPEAYMLCSLRMCCAPCISAVFPAYTLPKQSRKTAWRERGFRPQGSPSVAVTDTLHHVHWHPRPRSPRERSTAAVSVSETRLPCTASVPPFLQRSRLAATSHTHTDRGRRGWGGDGQKANDSCSL